MKFGWKKVFFLALILCLTFVLAVPALAEGETPAEPEATEEETAPAIPLAELADKISELVDPDSNRYEIIVSVPGSGSKAHNEVIIMVDGSYSTDEEWEETRQAIMEVGNTVLNGSGSTQLTLMTFGMGDNVVLQNMKSVEELDAALPNLPGDLLYGRSSTNCEAGFTGIQEYIEAQGEALNSANVIYITDGNLNTDETPRQFYDWKKLSTKFGAVTVGAGALEGALFYSQTVPMDLIRSVFGADATEESVKAAMIAGTITNEQYLAFGDAVYAAVYEAAGMDPTKEYPISEAERAFVDFDKNNGYYVQDAFYLATYKSSYVTYPNRTSRTAYAGTGLAALEKVFRLYMLDSDKATAWMNPDNSNDPNKNIVGDNVSFDALGGVSSLLDVLGEILKDMEKTPYEDVFVTDYMSKWVTLEENSIRIYDKEQCIYAYNPVTNTYEWMVDESARPTTEIPIQIELVDPSEYAAGGIEVEGNTSGNIYRIIWKVKDGGLLASDQYSMRYFVTVDTEEEGFQYGVEYVANGTTTVHHKDDPDGSAIEVPFVEAEDENPGYTPFVPFDPTPNIPTGGDEIEDNDTPLTDGDIIEDEDVPLVGMPNTGDGSMARSCVIIAGIAMVTFAAAIVIRRKQA